MKENEVYFKEPLYAFIYDDNEDPPRTRIKYNVPEEKANAVMISIHRYHGFLKNLKMNRHTAIKLVNRDADEHEYTLISCNAQTFKDGNKTKDAYLITKLTNWPVSMSLDEASGHIEEDLWEYYGYRGLPTFYVDVTGRGSMMCRTVTASELCDAAKQRNDPDFKVKDFYLKDNDFGRKVRRLIDENNGAVAFKIKGIYTERGFYKVTYWSTGMR